MNEHVPTTEEIRECYAGHDFDSEIWGVEFDTWLTEERAKVWDKAVDTLSAHYEDIVPGIVKDLERRNPYRAA